MAQAMMSNILLLEHGGKEGAIVCIPRRMARVEEAADHHVGLTRAAVVRPPVQRLNSRLGSMAAM
jgi:hypothetical protein